MIIKTFCVRFKFFGYSTKCSCICLWFFCSFTRMCLTFFSLCTISLRCAYCNINLFFLLFSNFRFFSVLLGHKTFLFIAFLCALFLLPALVTSICFSCSKLHHVKYTHRVRYKYKLKHRKRYSFHNFFYCFVRGILIFTMCESYGHSHNVSLYCTLSCISVIAFLMILGLCRHSTFHINKTKKKNIYIALKTLFQELFWHELLTVPWKRNVSKTRNKKLSLNLLSFAYKKLSLNILVNHLIIS